MVSIAEHGPMMVIRWRCDERRVTQKEEGDADEGDAEEVDTHA